MAVESSSTLRVAALGRSAEPGMLYDFRTETIVPHIFLWGSNMTPKNITCQTLSMSKCKVYTDETFRGKADLFGINDNLKLSIVAGLVGLVGASRLIDNRKTTNRLLRFILKHSVTTQLRSLTMTYSSKQYTKHPEVFDQQIATHVVTDIAYGAEFIFVFDRSVSDDEDRDAVEAKIRELLERFASFRVDSRGQLNWSVQQRELAETLTCQYYGDLQLRSNPTTFEEAVKLHKQLPKLLGDDNENAVPQQISIYPIYLLDDQRSTEKRFFQINDPVLSKALELFDSLHRWEVVLNDLQHDFSAVPLFEKTTQQLATSGTRFMEYETNLRGQIRKILPKIRQGSLDEQALTNLLANLQLSSADQEKVNEWMRFKRQEIKVFTELLDDLQGRRNMTLFTGSFAEMQRKSKAEFIFRLIIHLTERRDPFLNELLRYFNKHNPQLNARIDRWYDQQNLILMQRQIALFAKAATENRKKSNIQFLVNEEYVDDFHMRKGVTCILYRNGVALDFQTASQPGRPYAVDVSNRNVTLNWPAPTHGSDSVQQYKIYGRLMSGDRWQLLSTTRDGTSSATLSNLPEGKYQFKVQGTTLIGDTDESDISDTINVGAPRSIPPVPYTRPAKVTATAITKEKASLDVTPAWFNEVKPIPLEKVRLPVAFNKNSPVEVRQYECLATYRSLDPKTDQIDFVAKPFEANVENTETLVVVLNELATQLGTRLTFTKSSFTYDDSAYRTACGITNLGNIHSLLAAEGRVQTAKFTIHLDLDYGQLTQSPDTLKKFVMDSINDIASVAGCNKEFIRVFEVQRTTSINLTFALTMPTMEDTVEIADAFVEKLNDRSIKKRPGIFKYLFDEEHHYRTEPALALLQLQPADFDPAYNKDYPFAYEEVRGARPYHFPQGWYRHALKVVDKYPDDTQWLGMNNSAGEWAVAYHGTGLGGVKGIFDKGLLHDFVTTDVCAPFAKSMDPSIPDVKGLYVATHCDGGAALYTTPFNVKDLTDSDKSYRVVFQCRVQPGKFTEHDSPVKVGKAWRVFDEKAIRPYGLLLKKS